MSRLTTTNLRLERRVGGWAEVCVDEWAGHSDQIVFGYVDCISGRTVILRIADAVFSPAKTGLRDGQLIELSWRTSSVQSSLRIRLNRKLGVSNSVTSLPEKHYEQWA
jgi:hypothetical protein